MISRYLATPGAKSSEFFVTVLTVVWYIANAWADYTSTTNAVKLSLPAVVYVLSRGLAKYEQRAGGPGGGA